MDKPLSAYAMDLIAQRMDIDDLKDELIQLDPEHYVLANKHRQTLVYVFSDCSIILMDRGFFGLEVTMTDINAVH